MAILSHPLRLAYFDVTKVASTALKATLWEIDNGRPCPPFRPALRGWRRWRARALGRAADGWPPIHAMEGYRTRRFDPEAGLAEGYHRLAVVRDPIRRLRSAWQDKVHRAQFAIRPEEFRDLEDEGLPLDPDFGAFVDDFEAYRAIARPARIHTTPFSWHLGPDLSIFDSVHRLERIDTLTALLSDRLGRPVTLPRSNEAGPARRNEALTPAQIEKLRAITAPDYALLGGLYDPEDAVRSLVRAD